jgi:plastocyanin
MVTRRAFLTAGGLALAGLGRSRVVRAAAPVEVHMRATARGEAVWFDPIGLWVAHPKNDQHSLRIPEAAEPWDSGFLMKTGTSFDVTFTIEGVYDYYCLPHEAAGMVGRIIVGQPSGPGALPFDYFRNRPGTAGWKPVPEPAKRAFPRMEDIMRARVVRLPAPGG